MTDAPPTIHYNPMKLNSSFCLPLLTNSSHLAHRFIKFFVFVVTRWHVPSTLPLPSMTLAYIYFSFVLLKGGV